MAFLYTREDVESKLKTSLGFRDTGLIDKDTRAWFEEEKRAGRAVQQEGKHIISPRPWVRAGWA